MPSPLNHVVINSPRGGSTTQTSNPSTGTAAQGANFSPTAGRLLLLFAYAGATFTTPAGWTLPTNGSAVNNGGLYCWWRVAAGGDSISTTLNASNFPAMFDWYEFAVGSTFKSAAASTNVVSGAAGPTLASLTGVNWTAGVMGSDLFSPATASGSTTWTAGTTETDQTVPTGATDGYIYSLTDTIDNTATSASYGATHSTTGSTNQERLVVAVNVIPVPHRYAHYGQAVQRAALY